MKSTVSAVYLLVLFKSVYRINEDKADVCAARDPWDSLPSYEDATNSNSLPTYAPVTAATEQETNTAVATSDTHNLTTANNPYGIISLIYSFLTVLVVLIILFVTMPITHYGIALFSVIVLCS